MNNDRTPAPPPLTKTMQCPTCGVGTIAVRVVEEVWNKYCGDKKLWEAFSHAMVRQNDGTWSKPDRIVSIAWYGDELCVNFASEGSWPRIPKTDIDDRFRFISRKTGRPAEDSLSAA